MNALTEKISILSELGQLTQPNKLVVEMDGTKQDCPITFYRDGVAVFSMGSDEVGEFCEAITKLVP